MSGVRGCRPVELGRSRPAGGSGTCRTRPAGGSGTCRTRPAGGSGTCRTRQGRADAPSGRRIGRRVVVVWSRSAQRTRGAGRHSA
ncbi:hypothetical protein SZ60_11270 [Frigoribacterium sp. MEB024]|nr:hypothetical protein SZ60_11270 [Frigoribacterium sp. MEB024]